MGQETLTERLTKGKGQKQKGGGTKKHGRNAAKCKNYRASRSVRNKIAKLKKHLSIHVNDGCAKIAYERAVRVI